MKFTWVEPLATLHADGGFAGATQHAALDAFGHAERLGFDALGIAQRGEPDALALRRAEPVAALLARRGSRAAIVELAAQLPDAAATLRVAEEMAALDVLSGGRLVAAFAAGDAAARFRETHALILRAWQASAPFAFDGNYHRLPYVDCWPQPLQRPHPPVLVAGTDGAALAFCLEHDYAYAELSCAGHARARSALGAWWQAVAAAHADDNPHRAGYAQVICLADDLPAARARYDRHVRAFFARHDGDAPDFDALVASGAIVAGSPEGITSRLAALIGELRIGHLFCILDFGGMPAALSLEATGRFAREVMPRLRAAWPMHAGDDRHWIVPHAPHAVLH
ncbi:MAG: LLM class flavin-dependent oxidoreductase [Gammaproteobacteria bacterium]|nr:LLM class flavin-dependent oxidoreductase [Gammaproteobacteria bacterium]